MYQLSKIKALILFCVLTSLGAISVPALAKATYVQPYGFATVSLIKQYKYASSKENQVTIVGQLTSQRTTYDNQNTKRFVFKDNTGEIDVVLNDDYDWSDIGGGMPIRLSGYYVEQPYSSNSYFKALKGAPMNSLVLKCQ